MLLRSTHVALGQSGAEVGYKPRFLCCPRKESLVLGMKKDKYQGVWERSVKLTLALTLSTPVASVLKPFPSDPQIQKACTSRHSEDAADVSARVWPPC